MKTCIVIMLLCISIQVFPQNGILTIPIDENQVTDTTIGGIWQMALIYRSSTEKEIKAKALPIFKVYGNDHTFRNISFMNQANLGLLLTEGTFKVNNKENYTETIQKSASDPGIVGKDNVLTYKFINPSAMIVTYQLPNMPAPGKELWVRVKMPQTQASPKKL